jgi:two-component system chemotaxis sensor kinase CheA
MAADPYKYFRVEAREILDEMGQGMLDLEREVASPDLVARLLRQAHTLKGAARVVRQREIAERAHEIEDGLMPLRDQTGAVPRALVDRVLSLLDAISGHVAALTAPGDAAIAVVPGTRPNADPSGAGAAAAPAPVVTAVTLVRSDIEEIDAITDGLIEVGVQLAAVRRGTTGVERVRSLAESLYSELAGLHSSPATARLLGLAEDLGAVAAAVGRDLGEGTEQIDRELRQVREVAERLRLVPAEVLFARLERAARDAAVSLGKAVDFAASGGKLRLEAEILSGVQGAMIQAIRNAVAHGIEDPAGRRAAGKPAAGRITVAVLRRGSKVAFRCQDDGRGVDLAAVQRAAVRRGTLAAGAQPSRDELLRQLLHGGISTQTGVNAVAGRGIGLDVVRETAARLRGLVTFETEPDKGTLLEIVVPISSSALEVLVVEAGGQHAAIPLDGVRETRRLQAAEVARSGDGESIVHEGLAIPFLPLARCLGRVAGANLRADKGNGAAWSVVVVASAAGMAAMGVDRLLGTDNVVYRALPAQMGADATLAGVSLDVEGKPRVVLDAAGLVEAAQRKQPAASVPPAVRAPILVIDDSLTTRMLEQSILESAGYEVEVATCAEEGFEKAHQRSYGLFLVDVEMPGMDGFTFVERSRADRAIGHIPAILVTSRSSPEDRRRGELVGASGYIVKSEFDQNELLARIRNLVG